MHFSFTASVRRLLLCALWGLALCVMQHHSALAQGHSKRWVDSMKNLLYPLIENNPHFYADKGNMLRWISLNAALGDHYMRRHRQGDQRAQHTAMRYYEPVTWLSDGPDSQLGEDYTTIYKRDSVCHQVARICHAGLWPVDSGWSPYVGLYINPAKLNAGNYWEGPLSDTTIARLKFLPYTLDLSPDGKAVLDKIAPLLKADTSRRIVLSGGGGWRYLIRQMSWDQVNATINYLVEQHGIPRERFIFQYLGYRHNSQPNIVVILYAMKGEEGPCNVQPPYPGFTRWSRYR